VTDRHASLYLVSRLLAAGLNLVSVMVFTRLATPEVYGSYLVGFAIAFVVFGSTMQWLLHAQFGIFEPDAAPRQAGAVLVCLGVAAGCCVVLAGIAVIGGLVPAGPALAMAAIVGGLAAHVTLVELGRTRLLAREVTAASVLRGVLTLGLGTCALLLAQSAELLLLAIGLAQVLAALPILPALMRRGIERPDRGDVTRLLAYGWPLVPALGAGAVAVNLDRILLGYFSGPAVAGTYGAMSDLIRQGFVVLGEAIAASYVSQAKATTSPMRKVLLQRAATTLLAVVLGGIVAWLMLGRELAGVVLGPDFAPVSGPVMVLLVIGTALLALRAYYFGQATYFAATAQREVAASLAMLGVGAALGVLILPLGPTGAALAFALAQAGGLGAFVWLDRETRFMPLDLRNAGAIVVWWGVTLLVGAPLAQLNWWLGAVVLAASAAGMTWRWNLFGLRTLYPALSPAIRRQ
jgi:O-antigen/teichoic acid export membrane protein